MTTTQNLKEAAGMLEMLKAELTRSGLSDQFENVMELDVFSIDAASPAIATLDLIETEGPLEELRKATVTSLRRLEEAEQLAS